MANNAWIIVTDLHYGVTKEHRVNYLSEVLTVLDGILEVNQKYMNKGYTTNLLLLGDVVDRSIKSSTEGMRCLDVLTFFCKSFNKAYAVIGNHELTNIHDNPFWFLVSQLDDKNLLNLSRGIQPQGVNGIIEVPSLLQDGNVNFYFNHYGTPTKTPNTPGVNIGLFHQNIGSTEICKMWGSYVDIEESPAILLYNYSFFGHMHLASGVYSLCEDRKCEAWYLGSCLGTNVNEVEQLGEQLNIPVIIVHDGDFACVEQNIVQRLSLSEVIDYSKLERTQATQAALNEIKSIVIRESQESSLYSRIVDVARDNQLNYLLDILSTEEQLVIGSYKRLLNQSILLTESEESQNAI